MNTSPHILTPSGTSLPVGVGLKNEHFSQVLETRPSLTFFEVHAENFMSAGGAHHRFLEAISEAYPISVHGVGMSLGSAEGISKEHLRKFKKVVDRYKPWLVSEHLAWSSEGGHYLNDLLPLPLDEASLAVVARNVDEMQNFLGRKILVENPSSYLAFKASDMSELEFLTRLAEKTGCGLLLDVNNVYVSAKNMGWNARDYVDAVPAGLVGEVHLAGHTLKTVADGVEIRIDDHGSPVAQPVWDLYSRLVTRIGPRPTLIEWDTEIPGFDVLLAEATKAADIIKAVIQNEAAHA